jgi:hypothetical protein
MVKQRQQLQHQETKTVSISGVDSSIWWKVQTRSSKHGHAPEPSYMSLTSADNIIAHMLRCAFAELQVMSYEGVMDCSARQSVQLFTWDDERPESEQADRYIQYITQLVGVEDR